MEYGGAALRLWFLSGGSFIIHVFILITHLLIHRDHIFIFHTKSLWSSSSSSASPFFFVLRGELLKEPFNGAALLAVDQLTRAVQIK